MPKKWYAIQASDDTGRVSVAVCGYIGEWGLTDAQFIAELDAALAQSPAREVLVAINSRGGEVDHALSIFNHLRALAKDGKRIVVRVDGIAASAASIVAMAGDEIVMPANTLMMVHAPWTWAAGDAEQLRREADVLERFESAMIETYVARTGKSEAELRAMLAEDTWMTAQEAVDAGFADRVEPLREQETAAALTLALAQACAIPAEVLARVQAASAGAAAAQPVQDGATPPAAPPSPAPSADQADADALASAVRTLCEAARMPAMAEALVPFARERGLDAARDALLRAAATAVTPVNPVVPSSASDSASAHSSASSDFLARLALRAINPRARV